MTKVELFELIRKDYHHHHKSIRCIARERHIHRRTVRQALESAVPPKRKKSGRKCTVLTASYKLIIERWLTEDLRAPRKQRHTAQRIFERLSSEEHFQGSLSTIQNYVHKIRKKLGQTIQVFVPQYHAPGEEAEVDWYEAMVDFDSGREKVYFFQMRACHSGREFHMAFTRQNQHAFLEAHVAAFNYFGGVFNVIRYDNLTSAVKKVLRGRKRVETETFISLRSHYLFESSFCLPGIEGAHEKGGVEGGVGRFRRTHLVPVPKMADMEALNRFLLEACARDDLRTIKGQKQSIQIRWKQEQQKLQPLPNKPFETFTLCNPVVGRKSLVTINTNHYSVPVDYVGQTVEARIFAQTIEIQKQGKCIAKHSRCYERQQTRAKLEHYLPLLKYKPGALPNSIALTYLKEQQKWPKIYEQYWQALIEKHGKDQANRLLVDFLWWAKDYELSQVIKVLQQAMGCGPLPLDALKLLMRQTQYQETAAPELASETLGELARFERPIGKLNHYDSLIH